MGAWYRDDMAPTSPRFPPWTRTQAVLARLVSSAILSACLIGAMDYLVLTHDRLQAILDLTADPARPRIACSMASPSFAMAFGEDLTFFEKTPPFYYDVASDNGSSRFVYNPTDHWLESWGTLERTTSPTALKTGVYARDGRFLWSPLGKRLFLFAMTHAIGYRSDCVIPVDEGQYLVVIWLLSHAHGGPGPPVGGGEVHIYSPDRDEPSRVDRLACFDFWLEWRGGDWSLHHTPVSPQVSSFARCIRFATDAATTGWIDLASGRELPATEVPEGLRIKLAWLRIGIAISVVTTTIGAMLAGRSRTSRGVSAFVCCGVAAAVMYLAYSA